MLGTDPLCPGMNEIDTETGRWRVSEIIKWIIKNHRLINSADKLVAEINIKGKSIKGKVVVFPDE